MTLSRVFPVYHPKAGQPTHFVEAILTELGINYKSEKYFKWLVENNPEIDVHFLLVFFESLKTKVAPKLHTIRSHKRPLKVGDFINPKCWAGKPYNKTTEGYWQIKFAPDIEVKKVLDFEVSEHAVILLENNPIYQFCGEHTENLKQLASNDGLSTQDLLNWFRYPSPFKGQLICWSDKIYY